jgi:hypothetical protein
MRVYNVSTSRKIEYEIQINWSRESAFSYRQRNWIEDNIPNVPGVYMIYMRGHYVPYTRAKRSPVIYFGSGWVLDRLLFHLTSTDAERRNPVIDDFLSKVALSFRWAEIEDEDGENWPVVAEAILAHEFKRRYRDLPPANRIHPPRLDAFDFSLITQHPFDVIDQM